MKEEIVSYFKMLQDSICSGLEQADGGKIFCEEKWNREGGGGGRTRVLQNGRVIEKGGVNFSEVFGKSPDFLSKDPADFFASGVSVVIHPQNPMVPVIHMNVRYLELSPVLSAQGIKKKEAWFGGGIDLTPAYVIEDDARYFHQTLRAACDRFHGSFYPGFKKWADDYFFIKHRKETRGIGGIFFDNLSSPLSSLLKEKGVAEDIGREKLFEFVQAIGNLFLPLYTRLIRKNAAMPFGEKEKNWQLLRRGRYIEFNLVYDRGTKFGIETNGRTESILMSLPPQACWPYNFIPEKNSPEEKTISLLKKGIDWIK